MEQRPTFLALPNLVRRRADPDVPEDVEDALAHLNDPNWDSRSTDIATLSDCTFELEHKDVHGRYSSSVDMKPSLAASPSDYDTESRADSASQTDSRVQMRSTEMFDYEE